MFDLLWGRAFNGSNELNSVSNLHQRDVLAPESDILTLVPMTIPSAPSVVKDMSVPSGNTKIGEKKS